MKGYAVLDQRNTIVNQAQALEDHLRTEKSLQMVSKSFKESAVGVETTLRQDSRLMFRFVLRE